MLSFRTQNRLANLIYSIAEGEKKVEVVRQVLAEQKLFEPHTAFRRLDPLRNGFISLNEVQDFLAENKVISSNKEAYHLFKTLDYNKDGKITYNDFANFILSKEDKKLNQLCTLRESYFLEPGEPLPFEVEWALARVSDQVIKNFRNIESLREILTNSFDFTMLDCFNAVDVDKLGVIDFQSLDVFMRNCNQVLTDDEILAFFRAVGDEELGKVTYSQFVEALIAGEQPNLYQPSARSPLKESLYRSRLATPPKNLSSSYDDLKYQSYIKAASNEKLKQSRQLQQSYFSPERSLYQSNYRSPQKSSYLQKSSTKSPMKGNEEEHLVLALKQQINLEREVEDLKKNLALKVDFNVLDGFKVLDKKGRGYITKFDCELALNELSINPTRDELFLFFKRFDSEGAGMMKYSDFCQALLPSSQEYASLMNNRQPHYDPYEEGIRVFYYETQRLLKKILMKLLQAEVEAEALRQQLSRRPMFSLYDAFSAIDLDEKGFITLEDFKSIMQDYSIFVSQNDLMNLVKRYNKKQDGKITYSEFIKEMTPKHPTSY